MSFEEQCRERWTKLIALPVKNCPFIFAKSERKSKRAGNACWYLLKNSCLLSTLGTEHLLMISIDPQIFWSQNSVYRPFKLSMCMRLFWSINHLDNPSVIQLMFINLQNRLQEKDLSFDLILTFIGTTSLSCISLFTSFYPQTSQTSHQQCYSFFALIVNHKIRNWIEFSQLLFLICNSVIALHWSRLKRHSNQSWDTSYTVKKPNAAAKSMFMICIGICREWSTLLYYYYYFSTTTTTLLWNT